MINTETIFAFNKQNLAMRIADNENIILKNSIDLTVYKARHNDVHNVCESDYFNWRSRERISIFDARDYLKRVKRNLHVKTSLKRRVNFRH